MKKRIAVAAMAASLFAGAGLGIASADPGDKNDHGICTAYFNGQKKGHDKKDEAPGPFAELEASGTLQEIYDDCSSLPKGIGGNPQDNGRFTDCWTDTNDDPSDDCTDGS